MPCVLTTPRRKTEPVLRDYRSISKQSTTTLIHSASAVLLQDLVRHRHSQPGWLKACELHHRSDLVHLYHLPAHSLVRSSLVYPVFHSMQDSNHYRRRTQTRPATSSRPRKVLKLFSSLLSMARIQAALRLNRVYTRVLVCAASDALVERRLSELRLLQAMLVKLMASKPKQQVHLLTLQSQPLCRPPVRSTKPSRSVLRLRRTHLDPCSPSSDTSGCCSAS